MSGPTILPTDWAAGDTFTAAAENNVGVQVNRNTARIVNPLDYGAAGDGTTDDTTALQDCFSAVTNGGIVVMPPGKQFLYSSAITLPSGAVLQGAGRTAPQLVANASAAVLQVNTGCIVRDLEINCKSVSYLGLQIMPEGDMVTLQSVLVDYAVQAGFVFDATQNAAVIDCTARRCGTSTSNPSGWPAVAGYLLINGVADCNFYNCTDDHYLTTAVNYRAWLITNILAAVDNRFSNSVFAGGNRDNHWYGGIYEYPITDSPYPDYRIQITDGYSNGEFTWHDVQIVGPCNIALVGVGSNYSGRVNFDNVEFVPNANAGMLVSASSGTIRYRGSTRDFNGYFGLRDGTSLSGTAAISFDHDTSGLLPDRDRHFDTGYGDWVASGATIGWDSTTHRMTLAAQAPGQSIFCNFAGQAGSYLGNYASQYRIVRARIYVSGITTSGSATLQLYSALSASPYQTTLVTLVDGYQEVYYQLQGNEVGLGITQSGSGTASCEVAFVELNHIAC